jgi:hypothetical protein
MLIDIRIVIAVKILTINLDYKKKKNGNKYYKTKIR